MTTTDQIKAIDRILQLYCEIDIAIIDPTERGKRLILHENVVRVQDVDLSRLWRAQKAGEGVFFRPSKRDCHNVIFLDDVPREIRHTVPGHVVSTSPNSVQIHISTNPVLPETTARDVQRMYCREKKADPGCGGDVYHFRRLPGWHNTKPIYSDRPLVEFYGRAVPEMETRKLDVTPYVAKVHQEREETKKQRELWKEKLARMPKGNVAKTWQDYYSGDASAADWRYTLYCLGHGITPEQMRARLLEESQDLENRKKENTGKYIERTICKAMAYVAAQHTELPPNIPGAENWGKEIEEHRKSLRPQSS